MIEWLLSGFIGLVGIAAFLWRRNGTLTEERNRAQQEAARAAQSNLDRVERIKTNETARTADVDVIKSHDSMRNRQRD